MVCFGTDWVVLFGEHNDCGCNFSDCEVFGGAEDGGVGEADGCGAREAEVVGQKVRGEGICKINLKSRADALSLQTRLSVNYFVGSRL